MRARFLTATLVVVLAAAACTKSGSTAGGGGTITLGGKPANNHGTTDVKGKSSVDIDAGDFYFSPTVLHGTASQRITLHITNKTQTLHNFSDDVLNMDKDIPAGATVDIPVQFGNVLDAISVYYCKYHLKQGMVGAIQVPR